MIRSLWIAKTGLEANQAKMDTISNNLANVNTNGFKRSRAVFEDLLYQQVQAPGAQTSQNSAAPTGIQLGTGVKQSATVRSHAQGSLVATNNPFDMAVEGKGMFQVQLPDGRTAYTRDGGFNPDAQGNLVTANGYPLVPQIQVPAGSSSFNVARDGTVTVIPAGATAPQEIGRIQMADFINPAGLTSLGENLYQESAASGAPQTGFPVDPGFGALSQGYAEGSNVNVVEELVEMIQTQRSYEINSKAITTSDQMLQKISQI
jgi:flagellar basal-body rod protein FlgG